MKILLVSDAHHFSTKDVYNGYINAFKPILKSKNISFDYINMFDLYNFYNSDKAWGLTMAKMLNKECDFTHVLFISGVLIPSWLFKSKYDKKIGIISTDDPHSSKLLMKNKQYIDYWFTNEKKIEDINNNIFYVPTATDTIFPNVSKETVPPQYRCHLSFVGTLYDDRIKPLEDICNFCEEKRLVLKIVGPLLNTPKDSIIRKYANDLVINNYETKLLYSGSDIVINLDRNVNWHPYNKNGNPDLINVGEPYSGNPRMYEIAGCKSLQLFINARQEVKDIFGDNVFYCNENNIKEELINIFENETEESKLEKIINCFSIVMKEHTYEQRANKILNILEK